VRKSEKFFSAFLVVSSGLFCFMREVRADIPAPPHSGGTVSSADILLMAGFVVFVIAILSYLLLRIIRRGSEKDVDE
jgi:hypothetical protein